MSAWLIAIAGPTATGKTTFGIELAAALDGEIVNADALCVYRGLDIGTAKPSAAERAQVPHHLIDILDPAERYSAGAFVRRATPVIADIVRRGKVPIVVGGSGLYQRALLDGISPIPPVDEKIRDQLMARLSDQGLPALRAELEMRDPVTAARLAPGDTQRTLRALAVALGTGRPLAEWLRRDPAVAPPFRAARLGLTLPRAILYDRIAGRVRQMVQQGWVAEVAALLDRGVDSSVPAFQAIGYRQIIAHLSGAMGIETAVAETIRATQRYAKRQMTWYRKTSSIEWISTLDRQAHFPSLLRTLKAGRKLAHEQA